MIRLKTLLGAAILSAMAFTQANACSITAWSATDSVGVVAADAGEPLPTANGFKRYSQRCGVRVVGAATAKYVQDNTPTNATTYKSRFYVFTGAVDTGAAGFIFLARDGVGGNLIKLALTGSAIKTTVANGAAVADIPVVANKWYAVELEWQQAAGTFSIKARGAGAAGVTQTAALTASTAVLKDVRLGLSAAATGTAFFDEYDSRRTTAPGPLLKCDASGDGTLVNFVDNIAIQAEILGTTVAPGQPDANEDGIVNFLDRIAVQQKILGVAGPCTN
jgi:hypothetical protein